MNIRKFAAATFEEALTRVKAELGPDALILSSEEKRSSWFQKPTVEVTAAFEEVQEKKWDDNALEQVFPHRRRKPGVGIGSAHSQNSEPAKTKRPITAGPSNAATTAATQSAHDIESLILEVGVSAELARDMARQIVFDYPRKDRLDIGFLEKIVAKFLSANIKTLNAEVFQTRRAWAFVGSSGSGKTTALVKLALTLKGMNHPVQLASCDRRKIVGMHELAAYSKLIGITFTADAPSEKRGQTIHLLDTPSVSGEQKTLYKEVERQCRDASTVIVLDATSRLNVLLKTIDRFQGLAPVALVFTKLDAAVEAGVVHDVLKHSHLPLLGVSTTHTFSAPFRFFEPVSLARYLVAKARGEQQQQEIIESASKERSLSSTI